jgi:hypothetical protein
MKRMFSMVGGVGVAVVAVTGFTAANAFAANQVDGTISAQGQSCSWTNGSTSANPPSTLTINSSTINPPGGNLSCTGGVKATLNNNPTVTFNDTAGTATANLVDATVISSGISCRYQAKNFGLKRNGTTRNYSGSASVPLFSGSFLCPNPVTLSSSVTFH